MFVAKPEDVKSTGLHQPIGPCNITEDTFSITGVVSSKQIVNMYSWKQD